MFSIEIRVNGALAGVVHVQNTAQFNESPRVDLYSWEYHRMPYDGMPGLQSSGVYRFEPSRGIEALSAEILTNAADQVRGQCASRHKAQRVQERATVCPAGVHGGACDARFDHRH